VRRPALILAASTCAIALLVAQEDPEKKRNVIIFVADGLRHGSVTPTDTPALWRVRTQGVNFVNSHALFPTLTMPNAAAIATGHYIGDTGQFGNTLFVGYPAYDTGNFGRSPGSLTPGVEDNAALGDLNDHFGGNYLREASLVAFARSYGYNTAAVGKVGPAALQDVSELEPERGAFRETMTVILDGTTGSPGSVPLRPDTVAMLKAAGMSPAPPARSQPAGTNTTPGTLSANVAQQQWFADAVTKAILPKFSESDEPFVLVYWSGDPDHTQHAQGDSLNALVPGINGPTSRAAVQNADRNLKQIFDYLDANPELAGNTNLFVTSDHGFSTVSRREIDASGRATRSYSAGFRYKDAGGRQEVNDGFLPSGFLAIDLAHAFNLPLYDPDTQVRTAGGGRAYALVDPAIAQETDGVRQRPAGTNGLIGGKGQIEGAGAADIVVAGGSIYVPSTDRDLVHRIVRFLVTQDYIGGIFMHDRFGEIAGALPMSAVGLTGGATLPKPAVMVNFKTFSTDPANPTMTGVMISVGGSQAYQHGQGHHGSLSRANTFNNMAALGPDFKRGFVARAPVSNADIQPTIAHLLGMKMPSHGAFRGRVLMEALVGRPENVRYEARIARSRPAQLGQATVLVYQQAGEQLYFAEACFTSQTGANPCR
jgi:arylsulfatase A-like enzyme